MFRLYFLDITQYFIGLVRKNLIIIDFEKHIVLLELKVVFIDFYVFVKILSHFIYSKNRFRNLPCSKKLPIP